MRVLLLVMLLLLFAPSCDKAVAAPDGAPRYVEPLDDPQNPYKGKYSKWDERIYAVLKEASDREDLWSLDEQHKNKAYDYATHQGFGCYLDQHGYLIPWLFEFRKRHELYRDSRESGLTFVRTYHISVPVPMSDEEYAEFKSELYKIEAAFYPPIPEWLYEQTPAEVRLLPDGNIVCKGEPGVWQEHLKTLPKDTKWLQRSIANEKAFNHYLYDGNGRLLSNSVDWMIATLYTKQRYDELLKSVGVSVFEVKAGETADGYSYFEKDGEIVRILDYTGEVIPGDTLPPSRDRHNFKRLSSHELRRLYEAQQALKAETPAAP